MDELQKSVINIIDTNNINHYMIYLFLKNSINFEPKTNLKELVYWESNTIYYNKNIFKKKNYSFSVLYNIIETLMLPSVGDSKYFIKKALYDIINYIQDFDILKNYNNTYFYFNNTSELIIISGSCNLTSIYINKYEEFVKLLSYKGTSVSYKIEIINKNLNKVPKNNIKFLSVDLLLELLTIKNIDIDFLNEYIQAIICFTSYIDIYNLLRKLDINEVNKNCNTINQQMLLCEIFDDGFIEYMVDHNLFDCYNKELLHYIFKNLPLKITTKILMLMSFEDKMIYSRYLK